MNRMTIYIMTLSRSAWLSTGFVVLLLAVFVPVFIAVAIPTGVQAQSKPGEVRIDDFKKTYKEGETYGQWDSRKISPLFGSGDTMFFQFVHTSDAEHYLHLKSGDDNSFSLGVEQEFEVADTPILRWEWKVTKTPKGGDVRNEDKDDQAGSICLIVDPGLTGFESLCYLWENDGPKDTPITSLKREDSRYLILRTVKEDGKGMWLSESRNVLQDFKRVFGKAPDEKAIIGIQIDSDSTESAAEVFYRNIYRSK